MKTCIAVIALTLLGTACIVAQDAHITTETGLEAVKLPLPKYPDIARKSGLSGRITVIVTIDETGKVTEVNGVDGPYPVCPASTSPNVVALREAAKNAAMRAHLKPAPISLAPPSFTSYIVYIFPKQMTSGGVGGIATVGNTSDAGVRLDRVTKLGSADPVPNGSGSPPASGGLPSPPLMNGQDGEKLAPGGVLNGKATALPKPTYPAAARGVHAGGSVTVQVLIDEDGNIFSAQALTGHPLLRATSERAACASSFTPTLLSGKPVKVSGVIVYNFVP